jgi:hypothetical protein
MIEAIRKGKMDLILPEKEETNPMDTAKYGSWT